MLFRSTGPNSLPADVLKPYTANVKNGETMFNIGGCTSCHATPKEDAKDEDRLKLVVNHATNASSVTDADLAKAVGYDVFWTFPHDKAVPHSTQRGEPVVLSQPKARLAQEVVALAAHFGGTPMKAASSSSMFSLFRRK